VTSGDTVRSLFVAPGAASVVRCELCGTSADGPELSDSCAACGGLFEAIHARPALRGAELAASLRGSPSLPSGVWRFRELVMPDVKRVVSYPEGRTPLLERTAISEYAGVHHLRLKHEGFNPTGSFKDRGMTAAVTDALNRGARAIACASTGNTSSSLAAYAAVAGIPALVFVPSGRVASGKLAQTIAHGAKTLAVRGDFDAALSLARDASRELGVYLANSVNPWRIEGQKTITWELLRQLDWQPPDWIALPAGALGNTAAMGKALREALELGLISRVPRVLAVQAAGAAPFARGFAGGFAERVTVQAETVATAIRIGDPASWDRAVRTIRETDGHVAMVTDSDILDAQAVIDAAGVGCEPASAASVAGVRAMRASGVIAKDASVVCVLTGHLLKDPETVATYHAGGGARANPVIEIDASLGEVERVLRG
jgi:threonine synthase